MKKDLETLIAEERAEIISNYNKVLYNSENRMKEIATQLIDFAFVQKCKTDICKLATHFLQKS